jgi:hypothetical protein
MAKPRATASKKTKKKAAQELSRAGKRPDPGREWSFAALSRQAKGAARERDNRAKACLERIRASAHEPTTAPNLVSALLSQPAERINFNPQTSDARLERKMGASCAPTRYRSGMCGKAW